MVYFVAATLAFVAETAAAGLLGFVLNSMLPGPAWIVRGVLFTAVVLFAKVLPSVVVITSLPLASDTNLVPSVILLLVQLAAASAAGFWLVGLLNARQARPAA